MPVSLGEVRRLVAQDLGDFVELTASAGSTSTLTDPVELVDFDGAQTSSQVLFTSGANAGEIRRVLNNSRAAGSITFTPELDVAVQAGDTAELYNLHGAGFRIQHYTRAIVGVVREYAGYYPQRAEGPLETFDADAPELDIPADWIGVYAVHVDTDDGRFLDMRPARYSGAAGWIVRPERATVRLQGQGYLDQLDGQQVQLLGYERRPVPVADEDLIYLDQEWVRRKAAARLAAGRGDQTWNQWAVEWERMAAGRGPALLTTWEANTVLLEDLP